MHVRTLALTLFAVLLAASCRSTPEAADAGGPGVDRIVIRHHDGGDAGGVIVHEVRDPAEIARWLDALAALPEMGPADVRMISFVQPAPRHEIEFLAGEEVVDARRMMGGQLDVKEHPGWAFYSGQDRAFTSLVAALPDRQ